MMRKLVFVGMILVLMASFTAVLADQEGNYRWCNSDQYGCWVTNEEGGQDYIMFWSESARELFMGPGSNVVVADPFPSGKMSLPAAPAKEYTWKDFIYDFWTGLIGKEGYENFAPVADQWIKDDIQEIGGLIENGIIKESEAIDYFLSNEWEDIYY